MLKQGSTLIIDDKQEDGQLIANYLNAKLIPHLFFHADEENITSAIDNGSKIEKVRVIFQDLALTGGASPSKSDYDYAATIIEAILSEKNGPWLMVAWSTWADDDAPEEMFNHLVNELPKEKAPFSFVTLDKSIFTVDSSHGTARSYVELSSEEKSQLDLLTLKVTSENGPMITLMNWEKAINSSIRDVLVDLYKLSHVDAKQEENLGKLLFELVKAVSGKSSSDETAWHSLVTVLNSMLIDRVSKFKESETDILSYAGIAIPNIGQWKKQINKLLHFETARNSVGPGSVYTFNSLKYCFVHQPVLPGYVAISRSNIEVIPDHHVIKDLFKGIISSTPATFINKTFTALDKSEYVLIDVTPPCDFAQNKAEMIKLCAGVILDIPDYTDKEFKKYFNGVLLDANHVWGSCEVILEENGKPKILLASSRLIYSISATENVYNKMINASINRIRDDIFSDFSHWLWSQMSRPGYTYM